MVEAVHGPRSAQRLPSSPTGIQTVSHWIEQHCSSMHMHAHGAVWATASDDARASCRMARELGAHLVGLSNERSKARLCLHSIGILVRNT